MTEDEDEETHSFYQFVLHDASVVLVDVALLPVLGETHTRAHTKHPLIHTPFTAACKCFCPIWQTLDEQMDFLTDIEWYKSTMFENKHKWVQRNTTNLFQFSTEKQPQTGSHHWVFKDLPQIVVQMTRLVVVCGQDATKRVHVDDKHEHVLREKIPHRHTPTGSRIRLVVKLDKSRSASLTWLRTLWQNAMSGSDAPETNISVSVSSDRSRSPFTR